MSNIATFHANYQSFWHNGHGRGKQKGVWISGGAGRAGGAPLLTQHEYVLKTTTYQNNNSEGWSWSLSWVTCDIPGQSLHLMLRFTMSWWFHSTKMPQNLSLRTISHCRERVAWVCSSLTSERFFVCGWFRCWLSWAIVSGSEWSWWTQASSQELHYISLQQLRGMTHLQSKTVALSTPPATGPPATRLFLLLGMWNNDLDWVKYLAVSEVMETADGSCADCFHTLSQEESDECSTRHQTELLHNTEYRAGPAVASYFIQ